MRIGFSYKPPPRAPFAAVLKEFKKTDKPILSVDIPSGWDVEEGKTSDDDFTPSQSPESASYLIARVADECCTPQRH